MGYSNVLLERHEDGITVLKLNRPESRNAMNQEMMAEISRAIRELEDDDGTRVVVITGGTEVFSAGGDIRQMEGMNPVYVTKSFYKEFGRECYDRIDNLSKPVIAAVSGYALGGGTEMVLACDLAVASETAVFGLPEIKLGIIPGAGGTQRLPRLIGRRKAKELIFTGDTIDARTAERLGLVNRVVPVESLMKETMKLAGKIARHGGMALMMAKSAINQGIEVDLAAGSMIEARNFAILFATEDQKEGMRSFSEKRRPKFQGK
ncbi:MAG: enoyl-CoA hydratase/isomerase family protein [Firmicutes bacterium]|nr:enoyl-CoA hydratase/isomerase family protein [Bacillota bacterium]